MRIKKVRLAGFKSFVEPVELLIEPGLTGVVGPNGCGKSNLLEAIRWVMGEGSPKSLRGGGMEDVIFAGTSTRPARDFAEVSLLAETADGEQEVVRRIERGAGSAYRLNGRDVRQRDVALLFADAATGAHSPALVSQGRIAAVIAAKPTERRQMLEEAAGIAGLHVRRREAEIKLRQTETNLERLDEMLGEMEARANVLRRQARAAERYRALSEEIRIAEARSLFARWREAAAAAEQARARAGLAEQAVQNAAEQQRAAAAHAGQAVTAMAEARAAADVARDALGDARQALEGLRGEKISVERRLRELAGQLDMLALDREREDRLAIDATAALRALEEEDKALGRELAKAESARGGLEAAVAEAERTVRDAEVAVAQALARVASEQADARVAQAALAASRQRLQRAEGESARIAREAEAAGAAAPLAAALDQAREAGKTAAANLAASAEALASAEAAREQAAQQRAAAENDAAIAAAARARIESEIKALTAGLQRDAGKGVVTTLKVTPGYERALAAALGDDLDAPLGQGPRGWVGAAIDAADPALPEGVERLADHVSGADALARRLAQVAVVEDDGGQRLAAGQRLVTKAGALRRWDGFVARDVGAAAAERLVRVNRLAELERELPAVRSTADESSKALESARTEEGSARQAIDAARGAGVEAEQAARAAARAEDAAQGALDRHAAQLAAIAQQRVRADEELNEAKAAEAQAADAVAALPDRSASETALSALQAQAEAGRAMQAAARERLATFNAQLGRDQQRQQAARAEAKGWRSRAGDAAGRIAEMGKRRDAAEKEHGALAQKPAALTEAMVAADARLATAETAARAAREAEAAAEAELRRIETLTAAAQEQLSLAREARATLAANAEHQEQRRSELSRLAGDRFQCPAATLPDTIGFDAADLRAAEDESARHDRAVADRERLGPVNLVAESELAELEASRATNAAERDELGQAVNRLRGSIGSLNREGRQRLIAAFEAVDGHFRRLFTTLFNGGEAHLALIDSEDPLEAGLEIMAQPPGKRLGSLTLLSGGEQALTAVALIFALFLTNPAPICVLDEVDAPLDDANIERFCDLLLAMTRETETRYLVVTHNAVTMSRMHRLFGVTMIERGISRLVSVDLGGAEQLLAAE
ncbi:chromosome segregation protein [Sphingomonas vulcanisoli]|uniref:Chromosome partition protein Smc n=1 Tax=Sphingomonas vulcanisoli TaxID=1658060 RepID=A0ABX0TRW7_9SPHN|nr:chromosome segregation protein SMC [Sphingomonas vulcanisoli]NIJ08263.1 chromosome segregation protein [Sphingomonas vulcanisoli]